MIKQTAAYLVSVSESICAVGTTTFLRAAPMAVWTILAVSLALGVGLGVAP